MPKNDAERFVRELYDDESMREELNEELDISDPGEPDPGAIRERMESVIPGFARDHGYDFTAEEGFEVLKSLRQNLADGELSDDELEQVAGGKTQGQEVFAIASTAGIGVSCAGLSILLATSETECSAEGFDEVF